MRAQPGDHTVSVVIPSLHSPLIDQVVDAIDRQTVRERIVEMIVVGQDRFGRLPAHPDLRFIETPRPISAAAARNRGARAAKGDILLFLDADCLAAPDLLDHLLRRHDAGLPVVGGSVVLDTQEYWTMCDNLLSFTPFLSFMPAGDRPYLPSLNFCISRELFIQMGGFDDSFPGAAGEDTDLCFRLRKAGYPLFFERQAMVHHQPQRGSPRAVWNHLRGYGRVQVVLWEDHGDMIRSRAGLSRWAPLIIACAPLLATWDILRLFLANPPLWPSGSLLPGLIWGKIAWYVGVVEMLLERARHPTHTAQGTSGR